ncbi:MAG: DNA-processing protein DprA [Verrucomicrobiota bacterium]
MTSREAYLALNLLPKIGPIRVRRLMEQFGDPVAILKASPKSLVRVSGIGDDMASQIANWEDRIDLPEEQRRIAEHEIDLLTLEDDAYPSRLRTLHDPPFLLYVKGTIRPGDDAAIGVVGSRRTTHYGKEQARKLSFQLARAGLCVVSGLARGIDTAAHEAALAAGGRTLAVLGSGIGHLYPPENAELSERISRAGALISEFPVLYVPDKQSFPLRNRIVAGLSKGLLVVEAPARSGSMITANQALENGRTVFAVPGPIDRPTSEGCHRLIQQGANLVTSANDILDEMNQSWSGQGAGINDLPLDFGENNPDKSDSQEPTVALGETETLLFDALSETEQSLDQLVELTGLPIGKASAALLELELKRLIRQLPGKYFVKLI